MDRDPRVRHGNSQIAPRASYAHPKRRDNLIASGKTFNVYTNPVVVVDTPYVGFTRVSPCYAQSQPINFNPGIRREILYPRRRGEGTMRPLRGKRRRRRRERSRSYDSVSPTPSPIRRTPSPAYSRKKMEVSQLLPKGNFDASEFDIEKAIDRIIGKSMI